MIPRRGWLATIGVAGFGGGLYFTNENVEEFVDTTVEDASQQATRPPTTETIIGSVEGPRAQRLNTEGELTKQYVSLIKRIEFYKSGAAKIHPVADHGCYDAMAFRHEATSLSLEGDGTADTSDALATWSFGEFDEVLIVDMAGAISKKGNYPNSNFELEMVSTDGTCLSVTTREEVGFKVPDSYIL